ncbi:MAG: DUF167 domain-containing protein, partial [Acetobacteraceae bacterium]|nr:DUF167 domain-containing protein [Acetobacteraceae bacterium]
MQPRSRRPAICGAVPGADGPRPRIAVAEAAEGGRANHAACVALGRALVIPTSAVTVRTGAANRKDASGRGRPIGTDRTDRAGVTASVIDGKAIAGALQQQLAARIAKLDFRPGLAVVLVGDDPASALYVRNKNRAATAAGLATQTLRLPATTPEAELLASVARLNADPEIDGILVQLPMPSQIRARAVTEAIDPAKDVDGFHPLNAGRLAEGQPALVPCTPLGVMKLLQAAGTALDGARALVLGRSAIVGRPMSALLLAANATVTVAHSHTRHLADECRRAEILVAAVGRAEMVRG